jgi:trehalose utilization protein
MSQHIHVTVWNENRHEQIHDEVKKLYPEGMHHAIGNYLKAQGFSVGTATFDEVDHGLTEDVLEKTSVLTWWGHLLHNDVDDNIVERVQ